MTSTISLSVNARNLSASVEPRTHLADFLREDQLLTGTHLGCEHGVCGACTVLLDGIPIRSCITFAVACDGAAVRTVEGFEGDSVMRALRSAFSRHHALQCGYCTPGMLITAYDIVCRLPDADESRIREELSGNLCRCTGYVGIVAAIADVLAQRLERSEDALSSATAVGRVDVIRDGVKKAKPGARSVAPAAAREREGDNSTQHRVNIAVSEDDLWRVLSDPQSVVECIPGGSLLGPADAQPLEFEFALSLGPMRARFRGDATVTYDDAAKSGRLMGQGADRLSRSSGEGVVRFAVAGVQEAQETSQLTLEIDYTLKGPLAQFSRASVIDAVLDGLLEEFARNVSARASGLVVPTTGAAGAWGLLKRMLRRFVARS